MKIFYLTLFHPLFSLRGNWGGGTNTSKRKNMWKKVKSKSNLSKQHLLNAVDKMNMFHEVGEVGTVVVVPNK